MHSEGNRHAQSDLVNFHCFREEAKRKKCGKNPIDSACTFSSAEREVLDLDFAEYNPFCANNSIGILGRPDQCYGKKDISGPACINAAAGIKPNVMHSPLLVFMSICLFFTYERDFPLHHFIPVCRHFKIKFDKFLYRRAFQLTVSLSWVWNISFFNSWLLFLNCLSDHFL